MAKNIRICLDVGNTHIHAGLYCNADLVADLRLGANSDTIAILFELIERNLKEWGGGNITVVGISSVVAHLNEPLSKMCIEKCGFAPFFINYLAASNIDFSAFANPNEIGADLVAAAAAAAIAVPKANILIVDMGTATTITAINRCSQFLGGAILPGINTQTKTLRAISENLKTTELTQVDKFVGRNTDDAIKSGVFLGHVGAVDYLTTNMSVEAFGEEAYQTIITGGLSKFYVEYASKKDLLVMPNLVLDGIKVILDERDDSIK